MTTAQTTLPLWARKMPTRCERLRELLGDGKWHTMDELREVAGWRYGARLLELRRGIDKGPPLEVETRMTGGGLYEYRAVRS